MNLTTRFKYVNPDQEKHLNDFQNELIGHCQVEGKNTGLTETLKTEAQLRAFIMNHAEAKTQSEIDLNHQLNTPVSGMVIANKAQSDAREKINPLRASLTENEHQLKQLELQKKECSPDKQKRILRICVYVGACIIAIAEGDFGYEAFRAALIPKIPAIFTAFGIAVAVGFGSHFLGGYIKKAKTKLQRFLRYSVVLIPAFLGFYVIGNLRSNAYNEAVNLTSRVKGISLPTAGNVSAWSITIISFLLFLTALLFSIRVYKTEEERQKDQVYDRVSKEIKSILSKSKIAQNTIDEIQKEANEKVEEALARYEYALAIENRLQAIARHGIEAFKSANLRYRTDGIVPEFFSYPPPFRFKLFFDNLKTTRHEKDTPSYVS